MKIQANLVQPLLVSPKPGVVIPGLPPQFYFNGRLVAYDGSPLTFNNDTLFAIGSVSKTFTGTLYAHANLPRSATLGTYTPCHDHATCYARP